MSAPNDPYGYYAQAHPSMRMDGLALYEEYGERSFVYGRWDRAFGAWSWNGRCASPFVPLWTWLERPGSYFDRLSDWQASGVGGESVESEVETHRMMIAEWADDLTDLRVDEVGTLDAFNALIPEAVQRLARPFGQQQWLALEAMWDDPLFMEFLEFELERFGPRYVAGVWALAKTEAMSRQERTKLNGLIAREPKREILGGYMPEGATGRYLRSLRRLAEPRDGVGALRLLAFICCDPSRRRALAHWPGKLTAALLRAAAHLPSDLVKPPVLSLLAREHHLIDKLVAGFSGSTKIHHHRLSTIKTERGLLRLLEDMEEEAMQRQAFPESSLVATARLKPITSFSALRAEAARMKNCSWHYRNAVAKNRMHFLHWSSTTEATVAIRKSNSDVWNVFDIRDPRNDVPPAAVVNAILAEMVDCADATASWNLGRADKRQNPWSFPSAIAIP